MKELEKKQEAASTKAWEKIEAEMDAAIDELNKQHDRMISYFNKK